MKICLKYFLFNVLFFFVLYSKAHAVTTAILDYPFTITEQPFTVTASISGKISGINYLRIDLYKAGSTKYFGETFNNLTWYGGSDSSDYLPIQIKNGYWYGLLQGRIGNPTQTEYSGPGDYGLRIRRYTASGNYNSSEANTSAIKIRVEAAAPTLEPTNTPKPTTTPKPTLTSKPTRAPTAVKNSNGETASAPYSSDNKVAADKSSGKKIQANKDDINELLNNQLILGDQTESSIPAIYDMATEDASFDVHVASSESEIGPKILTTILLLFSATCIFILIIYYISKIKRKNNS